jgi:ABC-type multidrug transport system fused ATPase/permease subunit
MRRQDVPARNIAFGARVTGSGREPETFIEVRRSHAIDSADRDRRVLDGEEISPMTEPDAAIPAHDSALKAKVGAVHVNFRCRPTLARKVVSLCFCQHNVSARVGQSGWPKSTRLRIFNPMYDLYSDQHAEGGVLRDGRTILDPAIAVNPVRARAGMVFHKPAPFPMEIYENVAFAMRIYERLCGW